MSSHRLNSKNNGHVFAVLASKTIFRTFLSSVATDGKYFRAFKIPKMCYFLQLPMNVTILRLSCATSVSLVIIEEKSLRRPVVGIPAYLGTGGGWNAIYGLYRYVPL